MINVMRDVSSDRTSHGEFPSFTIGDKIGETLSSNWVTLRTKQFTPLCPPLHSKLRFLLFSIGISQTAAQYCMEGVGKGKLYFPFLSKHTFGRPFGAEFLN